jgi:hypothetical protein
MVTGRRQTYRTAQEKERMQKMQFVETEKGYLYIRECDRNIKERNKITYNIADGLWVTFGTTGRDRRKQKLCRMSFSKAWFEQDEAEDFWKNVEIRLLDKKTNWNRKLPELSFAIDLNNGFMITGNYKGLPRYEALGKQYEMMEASEEDIVDRLYEDWEGDDYDELVYIY